MTRAARVGLAACLLAAPLLGVIVQNPQRGAPPSSATLGLEQGPLDFNTPDFTLKLVKASQTVAALQPKGANGFDFTPADRLEARASDRFNSLGDLTFRRARARLAHARITPLQLPVVRSKLFQWLALSWLRLILRQRSLRTVHSK